MFDIQKFSSDTATTPAFGLMSRADKDKLNTFSSDTYLTKAEASDTYFTRAEASNLSFDSVDSSTVSTFATKDSAGNIISDTYLAKAEKAASAEIADSATTATTATQDSAGNVISDTYVTRANCVANVIISDTGVVFLNGNGDVVETIPVLNTKSEQSVTVNVGDEVKFHSDDSTFSQSVTVTRLGEGTITASATDSGVNVTVTGTTINLAGTPSGSFTLTINVAESSTHKAGSKTVKYTDLTPSTGGGAGADPNE